MGLSRRAVEQASGVSARALEKLEAGQQELSLSRAGALGRLYGLSLAQLAGEADLAAPSENRAPHFEAVPSLLGQLARILTGGASADVAEQSDLEDKDQADEPQGAELILQQLERLDQVVATGQQPRQLPAIVRELLQEGTALEPHELKRIALKRGITPPDGLAGPAALQLLIADALYDGIARLGSDELDQLADQLAAAAGVKRGRSWFGGPEVLPEQVSPFDLLQPSSEERRQALLRQLPPVIVKLALERRLPRPTGRA